MSIKENLEKAALLFGGSHEPKCVVITEESKKKISSDDFDITKHEFSDSGIECCEVGGGVLTMYNPELTTNLLFDDAIAIAKALGVTADDLI